MISIQRPGGTCVARHGFFYIYDAQNTLARSQEKKLRGDKHMDVLQLRRMHGMNQADFWSQVGVKQSGGSRHENGRHIPKSVLALIQLRYVEQIDIGKIKAADIQLIE